MLLKLTAVIESGEQSENISAKYAYEQKRPNQLWWNRNKCDGTVDNSDTIQFILAIGHDFTLNYLN